jgi:hypothetical protein
VIALMNQGWKSKAATIRTYSHFPMTLFLGLLLLSGFYNLKVGEIKVVKKGPAARGASGCKPN